MQRKISQDPAILAEVERLRVFFETTPILISEWREGCMVVKDIPQFIRLELNAAATFNPSHPFNPPLKRLQQLEKAIQNQTGTSSQAM
ncbi:DUF6965 family protein [Taibaiella koreensis]|uniref:DUF6965 family protein n=1 Tax=Taibaiella koreensis TaxID=1268548 RepID=UPI000E59D871|nr:hypothetical protein [Taibaiella koreensis]